MGTFSLFSRFSVNNIPLPLHALYPTVFLFVLPSFWLVLPHSFLFSLLLSYNILPFLFLFSFFSQCHRLFFLLSFLYEIFAIFLPFCVMYYFSSILYHVCHACSVFVSSFYFFPSHPSPFDVIFCTAFLPHLFYFIFFPLLSSFSTTLIFSAACVFSSIFFVSPVCILVTDFVSGSLSSYFPFIILAQSWFFLVSPALFFSLHSFYPILFRCVLFPSLFCGIFILTVPYEILSISIAKSMSISSKSFIWQLVL